MDKELEFIDDFDQSVQSTNVGKRITYFRQKKEWTVNKLANKAGISQSYLRDVELGRKNPTVEILYHICLAMHISIPVLFNDEAIRKINQDSLLEKLYKLTPKQRRAIEQLIDSFLE